jgi:hypothetical protein
MKILKMPQRDEKISLLHEYYIVFRSQDRAVDIVTSYGLDDQGVGV